VLICAYLKDSAKAEIVAKGTVESSSKPGERSALLPLGHAASPIQFNRDCQGSSSDILDAPVKLNPLHSHVAATPSNTFSKTFLLLFDSAATGKKALH